MELGGLTTFRPFALEHAFSTCLGGYIFGLVLEDYISALAWRFAFGGLEHEELVLIGHLETW